jgi:glycosyltransferase involved in cell wall biosynthesis
MDESTEQTGLASAQRFVDPDRPARRRADGTARDVTPPRPLRTIWVVDALHRNGAVHLSVQLARRLVGEGARLVVLRRLPIEDEVAIPGDIDFVELGQASQRYRRLVVPAALRLALMARRAEVVVNCSEVGMGLLVSTMASRLARRPLVVAVHADLDDAVAEWVPRRLHRMVYWLHRHVDGAICVSPDLVAALVRNGLVRDRTRVVRNGVDSAAVRLASQGERRGREDFPVPVVVATGRVAHQKGYDVLLRAHAQVVSDVPHRIHVHNDGPDLPAIRALVQELGVVDSVQFFDAAWDPLPHVARAAAFCLPSRHEGLPLSLLEAIVLGVPCIASDCSDGVRAVLDDGRVGQLVPVEDVGALAQALRAHLVDPGPLQAKAALGPAHAQRFDIDVMTRAWAEALGDLTRR